jgi:hypothetical protein
MEVGDIQRLLEITQKDKEFQALILWAIDEDQLVQLADNIQLYSVGGIDLTQQNLRDLWWVVRWYK